MRLACKQTDNYQHQYAAVQKLLFSKRIQRNSQLRGQMQLAQCLTDGELDLISSQIESLSLSSLHTIRTPSRNHGEQDSEQGQWERRYPNMSLTASTFKGTALPTQRSTTAPAGVPL